MGKHGDAEKEFQQAIAILTALVAEFPDDPAYANELARDWHNVLGTAFTASGRVREAEKELTPAIKCRRPSSPSIRKNRSIKTRLA